VASELGKLYKRVAHGHVSSQDGARQASILGTLRQALETEVLERQLTALEARLDEAEGV
jgi:hypothetical protein